MKSCTQQSCTQHIMSAADGKGQIEPPIYNLNCVRVSRQECVAIGQARYNVVSVSNLLTRMRCDSVHAIPRIRLLCLVQHSLHMNAPQNYTGAAGEILARCKS